MTTLAEVTWTQKDKYHMIFLKCKAYVCVQARVRLSVSPCVWCMCTYVSVYKEALRGGKMG